MEHKCEICDSTENLKYFATSGYIEKEDSKAYLSGGIYICDECLSICDECKTCGKIKASMLIEPFVNGLMKSDFFCKCPETKEEKEERYKREEKRYNKLQEKKRYEKTIKGIQKHINERNAKTEENKINELKNIKEKQDADKNRLLQLEQEVKDLKKENDEYYQKVFNLKTYLFLAVCVILFLIAMIFKS